MTFGGGLNDVSFAADPHCCWPGQVGRDTAVDVDKMWGHPGSVTPLMWPLVDDPSMYCIYSLYLYLVDV
jgi:hypothetical protein